MGSLSVIAIHLLSLAPVQAASSKIPTAVALFGQAWNEPDAEKIALLVHNS